MKKICTLLMSAVATFAVAQQDSGMHFVHSLTWQQVQAKAKAENKFIFVDAFTTWCGPCKMMAKTIFPRADVGAFYNDRYLNLKVQLDTTSKDNDEVKKWYADAHDIMYRYMVNVFPTYLFFSPEGKLVHRIVGFSDAQTFIGKGKDALNASKQYYTLVDRFNNGERDPAFLKSLAEASLIAYDRPSIPIYSNAYLSTQKGMLTADNIHFIDDMTQSSKDAGFDIIRKNMVAYNKVIGGGKAETKIKGIIKQEDIYPAIFESEEKPDWQKLQQNLQAKYPDLADELIANAKVNYYFNRQEWPAFSKSVTYYIKKYGKSVSAEELNSYAWSIFQNCSDVACISQALDWSKRSVDLTNNPMFINTYANLLYKNRKKQQAIQYEQKALKFIQDAKGDDTSYLETIAKMKKGEKTW